MKTFLLEKQTLIKAPLAHVWEFFSSPANLERITPPYMKFRIVESPTGKALQNGMLIRYKVRPVAGIPLTWVTEIREVSKETSFVDVQLKGPFALWEHTHIFRETADGVLMTDRVRYKLPFGVLGLLVHRLFIRKQLEGIFSYRERIIANLF